MRTGGAHGRINTRTGNNNVGIARNVEDGLNERLGNVEFHASTKLLRHTATAATWAVRASEGELTGGRASPWVEELPPFEAR